MYISFWPVASGFLLINQAGTHLVYTNKTVTKALVQEYEA